MKHILVQFIPIIAIFLLLTYTEKMVIFSNTGLGKLLIICIVLFYTSIDKLYGILVCLLFILFFQSDTVENMLNRNNEGFESNSDTSLTNTFIKPLDSTSYTCQYDLPKMNIETVKKEFRQKHCHKGHLVNKGQHVKNDMAVHVNPEISFINEKCNICDATCEFNINENQLNADERIRPKSGR